MLFEISFLKLENKINISNKEKKWKAKHEETLIKKQLWQLFMNVFIYHLNINENN